MNILFVSDYYSPHIGGVEIALQSIMERLAKLGHSVSIVTSSLPITEDFEISNGVRIFRTSFLNNRGRYWFTLDSIPKIWELAREADIIHTTTWSAAFPAWLVSRLRRKPCLITVPEVIVPVWRYSGKRGPLLWLHKLFEKVLFHLPFDKYVAISEYTYNCLVKFFDIAVEKMEVIYCGVDYGLFDPAKANSSIIRKQLGSDNKFVYMYYGRPGFTKGVEYLIQAVPLISKQILNSTLWLILSSDPEDRYHRIRRMIQELGIENNIMMIAPVPRNELPSYIEAADCVVIPSLSEGFGFAAVEASAMGKPVVATTVGSLPEVVSGRYVLVDPESPVAIAEGVKQVYKGEVKDRGKKIFSWDECVDRYLKIYQQMLTG